MPTRHSPALPALLLAACTAGEPLPEWDTPPRDDSPVQTDRLDYNPDRPLTLDDRDAVVAIARYTNDTGADVRFQPCFPDTPPMYGVVRAAPDSGPHVINAVWACVGVDELGVIAPGETVELEVPLGPASWSRDDPPTMRERTGLFRIQLILLGLPDEERQSNVFQVHPPDYF